MATLTSTRGVNRDELESQILQMFVKNEKPAPISIWSIEADLRSLGYSFNINELEDAIDALISANKIKVSSIHPKLSGGGKSFIEDVYFTRPDI
jgi:hypothetical protein